jgi:hypothetical protein
MLHKWLNSSSWILKLQCACYFYCADSTMLSVQELKRSIPQETANISQEVHHASRNNFRRCMACLLTRGLHFETLWKNKVTWIAGEKTPKIPAYVGLLNDNTSVTAAVLRDVIHLLLYSNRKGNRVLQIKILCALSMSQTGEPWAQVMFDIIWFICSAGVYVLFGTDCLMCI